MDTASTMSQSSAQRQGDRVLELDALRGIAAIAVVAYHLKNVEAFFPFSFERGHYGVELFFIVSGFVIFMTLSQARSLGQFVVSRFARLFPAYWCGVIVTICGAWALEPYGPSWASALINLTMLQAFVGVEDIDGSYWTLAIELEFYVFISFLFAAGLLKRILDLLLILMPIGAVLNFANIGHVLPHLSVQTFGLVNFGPFFAIGIGLYLMRTPLFRRKAVAMIGFALLCTVRPGANGQYHYAMVALALTAMTWLALNARLKFLRWPLLLWLGQISYPLYLVHQRIGTDFALFLNDRGVPGGLAVAIMLVAVILLAWAINVWIETPARRRIRSALQREEPAGPDTHGKR